MLQTFNLSTSSLNYTLSFSILTANLWWPVIDSFLYNSPNVVINWIEVPTVGSHMPEAVNSRVSRQSSFIDWHARWAGALCCCQMWTSSMLHGWLAVTPSTADLDGSHRRFCTCFTNTSCVQSSLEMVTYITTELLNVGHVHTQKRLALTSL